jgi:hypothetical protein
VSVKSIINGKELSDDRYHLGNESKASKVLTLEAIEPLKGPTLRIENMCPTRLVLAWDAPFSPKKMKISVDYAFEQRGNFTTKSHCLFHS